MNWSIEILFLFLIDQCHLYGYEIIQILKRLRGDTYEMSEGTLYSALKRLERKQWIESYWNETDGGRRKYYHITDDGSKELKNKQKNWEWMNSLIHKSSEGLI